LSESTHANAPFVTDTLSLRRVYIFLTQHGFMLIGLLIVILMGSVNYDNALGYMLTFLLGGMFLIAILHTYRNLAGLTFVGGDARPVFAGATAHFDLVFESQSRRGHLALAVARAPRANRKLRPADDEPPLQFDLTEPGFRRGALPVATDRRGWLPLGRIRVSSTFPLGMLRAWAYFDTEISCLVYPRSKGELPLPSTVTASRNTVSGMNVGSDDFIGLRAYALGDPPRAIAWKSLSKDQDIMVKRFVGGGETQIWLTWDDTASLKGVEPRLSQLTRWVVDADRIGAAYGLDIPGIRIPLGVGQAQRDKCLMALALFRNDESD
jgi:uncharacterized protein (DUF58 family)